MTGPLGEKITAGWGILGDGQTAVIEMAAAAGLPMVGDQKDPMRTTTYGVGELMRHALEHGESLFGPPALDEVVLDLLQQGDLVGEGGRGGRIVLAIELGVGGARALGGKRRLRRHPLRHG